MSLNPFNFPRWANYLLPALVLLAAGGALYVPLVLGLGVSPNLRWDSRFFGLVLVFSLLCVGLFIAITLMDTRAYAPNVESPARAGAATPPGSS